MTAAPVQVLTDLIGDRVSQATFVAFLHRSRRARLSVFVSGRSANVERTFGGWVAEWKDTYATDHPVRVEYNFFSFMCHPGECRSLFAFGGCRGCALLWCDNGCWGSPV